MLKLSRDRTVKNIQIILFVIGGILLAGFVLRLYNFFSHNTYEFMISNSYSYVYFGIFFVRISLCAVLIAITFYDKVYLWMFGVIIFTLKLVLLLNFFLFSPYEIYSVDHDEYYGVLFTELNLGILKNVLFGNNLVSFFILGSLYSYLIYLYIAKLHKSLQRN